MYKWFAYYYLLVLATTIVTTKASSERQGASPVARSMIAILASAGTLASLSEFVIAFWHMKWWIPITSLLSACVSSQIFVSVIGGLMVAKNWDSGVLISLLLGMISVVVFGILSYVQLFSL